MSMNLPFLACAVVTMVSALVSLGFSVASVPGTTGQTRALALYTCARSVAFATIAAVPLLTGSATWLYAVASGMIVLQGCDALIGVTIKDAMKTFGPAGTALANLAALAWTMNT